MSIPRNLHALSDNATIVPLRSLESYDFETPEDTGSDIETVVDWWPEDGTEVESEEDEEEMIPILETPSSSTEELDLLHGWGSPEDDTFDRLRSIPRLETFTRELRYTPDPYADYYINYYIETTVTPHRSLPALGPAHSNYILFEIVDTSQVIHIRSRRFTEVTVIRTLLPETEHIILALCMACLQDWAEPTRRFIGLVIHEIRDNADAFPYPPDSEIIDNRTDEEYFTSDEQSLGSPSSYYTPDVLSPHPFFPNDDNIPIVEL